MLSAAALTFLILILAGDLISRELVTRAEFQAGLGEAQELLGLRYEEQRDKLGHAIKDLHTQIRKRCQAGEADLQALNRELEKRVSRRTEELQEANKDLEMFSYAVSHDLRAPLRHMEGFTHFLRHKYGPTMPEEGRHYLDRISSAATFMSKLVEGLLQLSHLGSKLPSIAPVSLRALVHDARGALPSEAGRREIELRIGTLPEVQGDAVLLGQVFTNLLSNAVKFSSKQAPPRHRECQSPLDVRMPPLSRNASTVLAPRRPGRLPLSKISYSGLFHAQCSDHNAPLAATGLVDRGSV